MASFSLRCNETSFAAARSVLRISGLKFALAIGIAAMPAFAMADMPNRALTPGDVAQSDARIVCQFGKARRERAVSYRTRDRVYLEYGIPRGQRKGRFRIDHLIPLELGGSNLPANLWPQTYADSKRKDRVEGELHEAVCSGAMPLDLAQRAIARDWHTAANSPVIKP